MDDSGFQIEDPGPRIRKLPERTRKPLSGVSQVARSDSSGEMRAAPPAPVRGSGEVSSANVSPLEYPSNPSAEISFENPTFRSSGEFSVAVEPDIPRQSSEMPAENPWRDSLRDVPAVRTSDSSGEIPAVRASNSSGSIGSSGEIPVADTSSSSGDPRAAGGRSDRNSRLKEQRSQSVERRRSSGEWRVSGENRIPEDRRTSEQRRATEDRRDSLERRGSVERRVSDEFRIASEERRKSGDRRRPSGERRHHYTETSAHLLQSIEQPAKSAELPLISAEQNNLSGERRGASAEDRTQPQQRVPERTQESNPERWTLLQDRARSGDRAAAAQKERGQSQERPELRDVRRGLTEERRSLVEERFSQREESRKKAQPSRFKGPIAIMVLSALLIAYAFGYSAIQTAAETTVAGWNSPDQVGGSPLVAVAQRIIPYVVMLPPLLLLYGVLAAVAGFIGLRRSKQQKERSKRSGKVSPLDHFKEQADAEGVRPRYAYQAFLLLEQHLPSGHQLNINDGLEGDLKLSPAQVRSLRMTLLHNTDRAVDPNGRLTPVDSVLAMLLSAQQMPRRQRDPLDPVQMPGDPKTAGRR